MTRARDSAPDLRESSPIWTRTNNLAVSSSRLSRAFTPDEAGWLYGGTLAAGVYGTTAVFALNTVTRRC